ncbi:MAG: hypothetical protein JNN06_01350 [Gemmobacter sp.]|uniref:phage tail assembly chaperone n=1 Tax=Gemmobacter sp. TaxID=1898957 RepID=UPI001A57AF34|nr:hypothetical protein [Gemmobacter sp.]MBL8560900.1 hypothetical protein [Gemmobacter sp.]
MAFITYTGSTIEVSSGRPATTDAAGFAAKTYTKVNHILDWAEMGDTSQDVTETTLDGRTWHTNGPLDGGEYLVEAMLRLGPMRQTGIGLRPADWTEIDAFVRLTQRVSEPWEAEALFEMCAGYCAAYEAGEDLLAEAPMGKAETDISE